MRRLIKLALTVFVCFVCLYGCSYSHLDDVKTHAPEAWKQAGFEVVGYEGYEIGTIIPFTNYGGAHVWYTVKRISVNDVLYHGFIWKWGKEYHVYDLKAIDAIKPRD